MAPTPDSSAPLEPPCPCYWDEARADLIKRDRILRRLIPKQPDGFLQLESEKMSKSLGNFFTIREMLADWPGEVLRLSMLKTHYRSPLDWTLRGAEQSAKMLDDWYAIVADAEAGEPSTAMVEALYDDLNTAQAMAVLHGLRNAAASRVSTPRCRRSRSTAR